MKWFKHYTRAHEDRAIEKLIMEYGVAGYGLYIYCLEIIAGSVEPDNLTFELEPDAPILARRLSMDTILVERIMHSCIEMGLFELSDSGRLTCFKIRKYIDQNMTSNPQMREILRKSPRAKITSQSQVSHKTVTQTCDQIRLDEIRLEENLRAQEAPIVSNNPISSSFHRMVYDKWSGLDGVPKPPEYPTWIMGQSYRDFLAATKGYHSDDILGALDNFAQVIADPGKYWIQGRPSIAKFFAGEIFQACRPGVFPKGALKDQTASGGETTAEQIARLRREAI